jgi:uncharacterized protein involved in exopolysaccharide biosynthesis
MPYQYRSTATLKIESDPGAFERVAEAAFTRNALTTIVLNQKLYRRERTRMQMEDVIERMRREIRITPVAPNLAQISFAYEDPVLAQRVSQDLVSRIISANVDPRINQSGLRIQLTAPPDPPKKVGEGKRHSLAHLGFPGGMLFGVALALILRRRRARTAN